MMSFTPGQSGGATAVDLSRLPFPDVIEPLSFEAIVDEAKAALIQMVPGLESSLQLESDLLVKLIQAFAYRELMLRQRINDSCKAMTVAHARGRDLENLVALLGVARLLITPADPVARTPAVWESDEDLRRRAVLAPEGYSVAGPAGAYVFHALASSGDVLDASAISPSPGHVLVTVLSRESGGVPSPDLLAVVEAAVTDESIRPLTDLVTVQGAQIIGYDIEAEVLTWSGPDASLVITHARRQLEALLGRARRLGRGITRANIIAALHAEGARDVILTQPATDIPADATQSVICQSVVLNGESLEGL